MIGHVTGNCHRPPPCPLDFLDQRVKQGLSSRHSGNRLFYSADYTDRSPDFDSQLGFVPRVDIREARHFVNYRWKPAGRRIVSFGPSSRWLVNWDRQGRVQEWAGNGEFSLELPRLTYISLLHGQSYELFENRGFRQHSTSAFFNTEWLKWLAVSGSFQHGKGVNYEPAAGLAPFLADSLNGSVNLALRPTSRLRINQTYVYSRLGTPRAAIFNNHILRTKMNYQFSRRLSLRAILDYNAVLPNESLVDQERSKRLTADFLATYLINPGTAFYVGYTDGYENLGLANALTPAERRMLRRTVSPATSTGCRFFAKVSYLFRF